MKTVAYPAQCCDSRFNMFLLSILNLHWLIVRLLLIIVRHRRCVQIHIHREGHSTPATSYILQSVRLDLHLTENGVLRHLCGETMRIKDVPSYQKQINWHAFKELVRRENGVLRHLCGERMSIRDIPIYQKQINWYAFEELVRGQHVPVNPCVV
jgi:hypothetical protein